MGERRGGGKLPRKSGAMRLISAGAELGEVVHLVHRIILAQASLKPAERQTLRELLANQD